MEAKETKVQNMLEGVKQFVLPLFQRRYVWDKREWRMLWEDLKQLYDDSELQNHFMGSIVTIQMNSVPQGVPKYTLIDGQQRLTTIFIILLLLSNKSKNDENNSLSEEILNTFIVNPYKKNQFDYLKIMPTSKGDNENDETDRDIFIKLVKGEYIPEDSRNQIYKAYKYFEKEIASIPDINIQNFLNTITLKLSIVSILLHDYDNPYLVFESLNHKGSKLLPSDLIRNYFFMKIHTTDQINLYNLYWLPMEKGFTDEALTEFIRHYLIMREGAFIKENIVYDTLRKKVSSENAISELQEIFKYSKYYERFLYPVKEPNEKIRNYFIEFNILEVSTMYPFLLKSYGDYAENRLSLNDFIEILRVLENYLVRRYICNIASSQLNKIFPSLYKQIQEIEYQDFVMGLKTVLQTKDYPKNDKFARSLKEAKLYGAGSKIIKTKLILSIIENSFTNKERVNLEKVTIEHVMPQKIEHSEWKQHLGDDWETIHELWLHTIGNLTLTGYNSEMSNKIFLEKKKYLSESKLEINKYFDNINDWNEIEIERRSDFLIEKCLKIWEYFGEQKSLVGGVKGTKPAVLTILGDKFDVKHWADVLEITLNTIYDWDKEKFDLLKQNFPTLFKVNSAKHNYRTLKNGENVKTGFDAERLKRYCTQAIQTIEFTDDHWNVELN